MILCDPTSSYEERETLFNLMGEFFVPKQKDTPFESLRQDLMETTQEEAVKLKVERALQFYEQLEIKAKDNTSYQVVLDKVNQNILALYGSIENKNPKEILKSTLEKSVKKDILPEYMLKKPPHMAGEVEVEDEVEVEVEVKVEVEVAVQYISSRFAPGEVNYTALAYQKKTGYYEAFGYSGEELINAVYSEANNLTNNKTLKALLSTFPLKYSKNQFLDRQLSSEYYLPCNYILITKQGEERQYVIVSHLDAAYIKRGILREMPNEEKISNSPQDRGCALFSLDREMLYSSGNIELVNKNKSENEFNQAIALTKFLTGQINFNPKEISSLKEMIEPFLDKPETVEEMKKLFEQIIGSQQATIAAYPQSLICQFLNPK